MKLADWIELRLILNPQGQVPFKAVYGTYAQDLSERGLLPLGVKNFSKELRTALEEHIRSQKVAFVKHSGLILRGVVIKEKIKYDTFYK